MKNEMLALILAGGQGTRLGNSLKALPNLQCNLGGRYRIIDFALSNCANSGIHNVGVNYSVSTACLKQPYRKWFQLGS